MVNIILGLGVLIISILYTLFLIRRRLQNKTLWSMSMLYKGLIGGIVFIIIGIMLIVKGCNGF